MTEGKILHKVAYNGVNKASWLEDASYHKPVSTFLNVGDLQKSGRNLQADLEKNGLKEAPREFVGLKIIEY